jgi:predicted Rossmann-fold nucleotide-binding protein
MDVGVVKVAVVGSRTIQEKDFVFKTLDFYLARLLKENEVVIVSGGAVGIDSLAVDFAEQKNLKTEIYLPDYKQYGKGATHIRNKQIVEVSDYLIAITTGSNGTASTIKYANQKGIPTKIIEYEKK